MGPGSSFLALAWRFSNRTTSILYSGDGGRIVSGVCARVAVGAANSNRIMHSCVPGHAGDRRPGSRLESVSAIETVQDGVDMVEAFLRVAQIEPES